MNYKIEEELQVKKECDVLVAGGGVAGVAAAVSASRHGKKVLLVDKAIKLGGLATLGLINLFVASCDGEGEVLGKGMFMEFVEMATKYGFDHIPPEFVGDKISAETLEKLKREGKEPPRFVSRFSAEIFSLCLTELCVKENVELMFDTVITNVIKDKNDESKIEAVIIENKDGRGVLKAKQFVDTTGDSDLLFRLGVPTVERGNYHSYNSYVISYETIQDALEKKNIDYACRYKQGGKASLFGKNQREDIPLYYGTHNSEINRYVINNHKDLLDSLKKDEDRFSRDIVSLPDMCQFRTTRRIDADYVMKEEDHNHHFDNSICTFGDFCYRKRPWEIPYSSLVKTGFPNVITAGRTIGSEKFAWDETRVIPPAILTGQAAGLAASQAIDEDSPIYAISVPNLQKELENCGVQIHFDDRFLSTFGDEFFCTDNN